MTLRLKRIGLIGDIHAEHEYLETALQYLKPRVDRILAVGDIVDGRGDTDRCVELLKQYDVACVRGNHDRWLLASTHRIHELFALSGPTQDYLATLPATQLHDTVAGPLLLCHGLGEDDMVFIDTALREAKDERKERGRLQRLVPGDVKLVVAGHTHQRGVQRLGRGISVINAGTLKDGDNPCFGILNLDDEFVQYFDLEDGGVVRGAEIINIRGERK